MNRINIIGIAVAAVVLMFALAAKSFGTDGAAQIMLPLLAAAMAVLFFVDLTAYRKGNSSGVTRATLFIRMIMLAVMTLILAVASVLIFVF